MLMLLMNEATYSLGWSRSSVIKLLPNLEVHLVVLYLKFLCSFKNFHFIKWVTKLYKVGFVGPCRFIYLFICLFFVEFVTCMSFRKGYLPKMKLLSIVFYLYIFLVKNSWPVSLQLESCPCRRWALKVMILGLLIYK